MAIEECLESTLHQLEAMYAEMEPATGNVLFRDVGPYRQFRHEALTDSLACYLKGAKLISTLNACFVLLKHGYAQEIGALCRMVDDFCNEVFFLLQPQGENGAFSSDQVLFLENFFQKRIGSAKRSIWASTQKRNTVLVKKHTCVLREAREQRSYSSDAQELLRTTLSKHSPVMFMGPILILWKCTVVHRRNFIYLEC